MSASINETKSRIKSSWTPLANEEANKKIFEERRSIILKWNEKWKETQRRIILVEILNTCKQETIEAVAKFTNKRSRPVPDDFTRQLPRAISLYIFSFLDPRSLCRCSQVNWYWKILSENDDLWAPKATRVGWCLPFEPSPFESGMWKRLYIENLQQIRELLPKETSRGPSRTDTARDGHTIDLERLNLDTFRSTSHASLASHRSQRTSGRKKSASSSLHPPPWRGSDKKPSDIHRLNYLDSDDVVAAIKQIRKRQKGGAHRANDANLADANLSSTRIVDGKRSVQSTKQQTPQPKTPEPMDPFSARPLWARPKAKALIDRPHLSSRLAKGGATMAFESRPWTLPNDEHDGSTFGESD